MTFIAKLGINFILLITISGSFSLDQASDVKYEHVWTGACSEGRMQSPIAIPNVCGRTFLSYMDMEYTNMRDPITNITVTNSARQTVFTFDLSVKRSVVIKTTNKAVHPFKAHTPYFLVNFHMHHSMNNQSGTLHSINGQLYAVEVHFLFVLKQFYNNVAAALAAPGNALEIVVLWKTSNTNNAAWTQLNNIMLSKKLKENEKISSKARFRLTDLIPNRSTYTFYHGSLPAARCLEVMSWIVYDLIMEFNIEDVGARHWTYISNGVEVPLTYNTRRIQSLNARPVYQGLRERVSYIDGKAETMPHKPSGVH